MIETTPARQLAAGAFGLLTGYCILTMRRGSPEQCP